jgi:hypothetical protein
MNKKVGVAIIVLLFILPLALKLAICPEITPETFSPEELEKQAMQLEKLKNQTEWQYLGIRFQESLMKNPVIAGIDSFCKKISIVFSILFGMPYSLSITLLFVMAMWFIVFMDLGNIIHSHSAFSGTASYGISLAFAIMFSQLQIFRFIVDYTGTLIYSKEEWWARTLLILAVILLIIVVDRLSRLVAKYLKGLKKLREEAKTKVAQKATQEFAKGIEKRAK